MTSMQDYRVELEAYSGPLDLLLFLVRRDEIDLADVPIARLTEQYLEHLKLIQPIDVNLAGEFLVMAATLLEIKSAMLVPKGPESEANQAEAASTIDQLDPRYELVQQLLAYKRFKDAAAELEERRQQWQARYVAVPPRRLSTVDSTHADGEVAALDETGEETDAAAADIDLEDLSVADLCDAFARILDTIGQNPLQHQIVYDDTPMGLHAEDILDRLSREGPMAMQSMFVGRSRSEAIGLFLAMLELVRQHKIRALQADADGVIKLELSVEQANDDAEAAHDPAADASRWVDPHTGQVQYEWPSEEARLAAQRRAKIRASRAAAAAKGQFAKAGETDAVDASGAPGPDDEIVDVDGPTDEPGDAAADAPA